MYVYEEIYKGRKLHELINETHENPKYLPGIALPQNIRAVSNIREVVANAHVLIFVRWHTTLRVNRREGVCGNEDSRRDRGRENGREGGRVLSVPACSPIFCAVPNACACSLFLAAGGGGGGGPRQSLAMR